ncbi:MAG: fatty-acid oxidation protein subunit alpha [Saprospiraceae bacterium]|nr:fatty-acid oxidation protein subunit alpha [Saprospiraceae bacterium]
MAAKDKYHDLVKDALIKDGWKITHDPLRFKTGEVEFKIDLGAEEVIGAEKGDSKMAVEIKVSSALRHCMIFEALGQFNSYVVGLETYEPDRVLFLAIPKRVYDFFFQKPGIQLIVKRNNLKIVVYNIGQKKIEQWIK